MKPSTITATLGIVLTAISVYMFIMSAQMGAVIPILIGASLLYPAFRKGRVATLIFGHTCILIGAYLITWGVYLLPVSQPILGHIFGRPLFWGIFH